MPHFELLLSAQLTNVKELLPPNEDTDWFIKIKCTNCGEIHEKFVSINSDESFELKGDRSSANLIVKCKFCGRELTADIVEGSTKAYIEDDSGIFRPIIRLDCNGFEPVDFSLRSGWQVASSVSETVFSDVDLSSGEWTDYDDKAGVCLEIMEIQTKFIRAK
ncbi:hypothetical protein Aperf_G00000116389 [Anoplocephala perfoliata]